MGNDNRVVSYVDDSTYRSLTARVDTTDVSQSEWVRDAIEEKLDRAGMNDAAHRFKIEERLLSIADDIADRAADQIVEDVRADQGGEIDHGEDTETADKYEDWGE